MSLIGRMFIVTGFAALVAVAAGAQDHAHHMGGGATAAAEPAVAAPAPDGPSRIEVERKRRAVRSAPPAAVLPPEASSDSYSTGHNTQLTRSAPGVLADDTLRGATLVSYGATLGTEQTTLGVNTATAQSGTIRMEASGSFVYNPAAGFSGTDSFRYTIANSGGSSSAKVTVTVDPAAPVADFVVTSPGFFFAFSGVSGQNPVLKLTRGRTYTFQVDTSSIHPFQILDAPPGSVTNNNIDNGILTFAVPTAAVNYRYHCSIHEFGNTIQTVAPASAADAEADAEQLEKNRRTVFSFFDLAFGQARPREAMERFGGDSYVHNDPAVPDGREGFIAWLEDEARRHPARQYEILRAVAEDDVVALHTRQHDPEGPDREAVHLFRVDDDGRVVEHWGVVQRSAPPAAEPAD